MYATYAPQTIDRIKDTSIEDAWKLARKGKFSASSMHKLLSKGTGGNIFGAGALTYINEVACDAYTEFEDNEMETYDMKMGKILEPQAAAHHRKLIGVDVIHYGGNNPHFEPYCSDSGGSPDAVAFTPSGNVSFGAEFKCPKKVTHWNYIKNIADQFDLLKVSSDYYTQVQFLMTIYKCDLWHWCSYNDFFPMKHKMHIIEVKPDKQFMDNLLIRLKMAIKKKYELVEELRSKG